MAKNRKKVIIMGAAGRDFHNFNTLYRDNENVEVVAFTATQIPDIDDRKYPAVLAGKLYPKGIPIYEEAKLLDLIREHGVDEVIFSYSDVPYQYVMEKAAYVMSAGARFAVEGGTPTMIKSTKPVVAVCAVRTGCGKSQTTRKVAEVLQALGKKVVAIRHPMPYGDLAKQACQRFATLKDLDKHKCTIEEREEYEPHINRGIIVYAGVDYEMIIREAEKEADVILWDGGNNDMSFYKPDLLITVVDPHRPGHEISYYPGQNNLLMADVIVINKIDSAEPLGRINLVDDDDISHQQVVLARIVRNLVARTMRVNNSDGRLVEGHVVISAVPQDDIGLLLSLANDHFIVNSGIHNDAPVDVRYFLAFLDELQLFLSKCPSASFAACLAKVQVPAWGTSIATTSSPSACILGHLTGCLQLTAPGSHRTNGYHRFG